MNNPVKYRILVLDDEVGIRKGIQDLLIEMGYDVTAVAYYQDAYDLIKKDNFDAFIVDLNLADGESGLDFLKGARDIHPNTPFAIVSGYLTNGWSKKVSDYLLSTDVLCIQIPKLGYKDALIHWAKNLYNFLKMQANAKSHTYHSEDIRVKKLVNNIVPIVASSGLPVLIIGESGTGKEDMARLIHNNQSNDVNMGPFVAVNCAAINDNLILSDLFGHVKGAFTGAIEHRLGLFLEASGWKHSRNKAQSYLEWLSHSGNNVGYARKAIAESHNEFRRMQSMYIDTDKDSAEYCYIKDATHGTLFLDEIGDLSTAAGVALLRALDGYGIRPLGYTGPSLLPHCRVIAATNRIRSQQDLRNSEEIMRRDLFERLAGWVLELPALRDRKLPDGKHEWCNSFMMWAAADSFHVDEDDLTNLQAYLTKGKDDKLWEGNWRELHYFYLRSLAFAKTRNNNTSIGFNDMFSASKWVLVEGNQSEEESRLKKEEANEKHLPDIPVNREVEERLDIILLLHEIINRCDIRNCTINYVKASISSIDLKKMNLCPEVKNKASDIELLVQAASRCMKSGRVIAAAVDILMSNEKGALKMWWRDHADEVVGIVRGRPKYSVIVQDLINMSPLYFLKPLSGIIAKDE